MITSGRRRSPSSVHFSREPIGEHPDLPPELIAELHTYRNMLATLTQREQEWHNTILMLDGGWNA